MAYPASCSLKMIPAPACDIFCTVIDNYGDIATCWRLAHILRHDHGMPVRLFVDDLDALKPLVPATQNRAQQNLHGIDVRHWTANMADTPPAPIVIETFGCPLPTPYVQAMQHSPPQAWINLEYMSCEPWVNDVHGQSSLLANGLSKRFIIPSLLPHSGGLLREKNLLKQRDSFLANPAQQQAWRKQWGIPTPAANSLKLSLFAYENPHLGALLDSLSRAHQAITAYLPACRLLASLGEYLNQPQLKAGDSIQLGSLQLHILPFLPQAEYDRLLWLCDINFVRGEESLTRALWAGKPLIWHIYPTEDQAHHTKLQAFLDTYTEHSQAEHLIHLKAWMQHWNGINLHTSDAYTLLNTLHQNQAWYKARSAALAQVPDLSQNILNAFAF